MALIAHASIDDANCLILIRFTYESYWCLNVLTLARTLVKTAPFIATYFPFLAAWNGLEGERTLKPRSKETSNLNGIGVLLDQLKLTPWPKCTYTNSLTKQLFA